MLFNYSKILLKLSAYRAHFLKLMCLPLIPTRRVHMQKTIWLTGAISSNKSVQKSYSVTSTPNPRMCKHTRARATKARKTASRSLLTLVISRCLVNERFKLFSIGNKPFLPTLVQVQARAHTRHQLTVNVSKKLKWKKIRRSREMWFPLYICM